MYAFHAFKVDWTKKIAHLKLLDLQSMQHVRTGKRDLGQQSLGGCDRLPRLYSKQAPARGWEAVQAPRWVQKQLEAERAENTLERPKTRRKTKPGELCAGFAPGFPCLFSKTNIGGPARPDSGRKCI